MLQFMGLQRVGHDLATEQQQQYLGGCSRNIINDFLVRRLEGLEVKRGREREGVVFTLFLLYCSSFTS